MFFVQVVCKDLRGIQWVLRLEGDIPTAFWVQNGWEDLNRPRVVAVKFADLTADGAISQETAEVVLNVRVIGAFGVGTCD